MALNVLRIINFPEDTNLIYAYKDSAFIYCKL